MKFYDCTVRLGGSLLNEVNKTQISAAEIVMLRLLHGGDGSVVRVTETQAPTAPSGGEDWTDGEVREFLRMQYGNDRETMKDKVQAVFGPPNLPLPHEVEALPEPEGFDVEAERARIRAEVLAEGGPLDEEAIRAQVRAEVLQEVANEALAAKNAKPKKPTKAEAEAAAKEAADKAAKEALN